MPTKPRRVHYVLSSHWDREWYLTFQAFRYHLVRLFDQVLAGLARGDLAGPFFTDGQAIPLEDYLEVRPEQRETVQEYLRQGKIIAGPWYVMPDEFLVSGEALVRNLEYGRRLVRSLGGQPSDAGFVCDIFGHNSQMPQILSGFGIRFVYLWRGLNLIERRNFRWRGADGTEILGYRFGRGGYCDYAMKIRHIGDPGHVFDPEKAGEDLRAYIAEEASLTEVDPILAFDGGDHIAWDPETYSILANDASKLGPGFEAAHTSLDAYQAEVLAQADRITPCVEGELRQPGFYPAERDQQDLIPGVLSSRVWIKQLNAECLASLCQWAEPVSALSSALLAEPDQDQEFLNLAWRWLLQNHPHDSICGCSIDAVHEDMRYRFAQSRQIADGVAQQDMQRIAASITGELDDESLRVTLFNPLPQLFDGTVELNLDIPVDWPRTRDWFTPEAKPVFQLYGPDGQEIACQVLSIDPNRTRFNRSDKAFPKARKVNSVAVSLAVQIPALGYTSLTARAGRKDPSPSISGKSTLSAAGCSLANELLRVDIEPNGSLTLSDLRTGRSYRPLMVFEDSGDIGNGYNYRAPASNQVITSTGCQADISLIHEGPCLASIRIHTLLRIPAEFDFETMRRASQWTEVAIDSTVSLRPGTNYLEVENTISNTAKDHRLRALFMSRAFRATTYLTDTPFDVVERPISPPSNAELFREPDPMTRPQQSWAAVFDDQGGLAVVAPGLMEVMVQDRPGRPVALTLFRSTRNTVLTDGEPGGQLLGPLHFTYYLSPLLGPPDRASLGRLAQRLSTGVRDVQLSKTDLDRLRGSRALPQTLEYLKIDGPVVATSIRRVNGGLEVRLFNPTTETVRAAIELMKNDPDFPVPGSYEFVDFEHHPTGPRQRLVDRTLSLEVEPKKIQTIRFTDAV